MSDIKKYARIAKSNGQVCAILTEKNGTFDFAPSHATVFDVEITSHAQKDELKESWFYHSDGTFNIYPEGYVEPIYEPTETEVFQAEALLNQSKIEENQRLQDEALAEILLQSVGGQQNV